MTYEYQKLTPTTNADIKGYEEALDYIFREDELKNIAISGSYGAGKSSALETYKNKRNNIKFIHISLSQFGSMERQDDNSGEKSNSITEKRLEGKILNQLIHQVGADNIPLTKFQVKREEKILPIIGNVSVVAVWGILIGYIVKYDLWKQYLTSVGGMLEDWLWFTLYPCMLFVVGVIIVIISVFLIGKVVLYQKSQGCFKKIKIADSEIELFDKKEESLFDRYLDEVLYIFNQSKVNAIVFEDIDRYNSVYIFQQLKEVNRLVNIKRMRDKDKPLKFIYLLKDDMFMSKDRTKFFDFILPIIPVMDGSNSYEKIIEIFKSMQVWPSFDSQFLQEVSFYIDDMRLLKNIANEFNIYSNNVMTTGQDVNKMLAMMIYKNIFPKDYGDLQLSRGYVYNIFAYKSEIANIEKQNISRKIKVLEKENEEMKKLWQTSRNEINEFYDYKIEQARWNQQVKNKLILEKEKRIELFDARNNDKISENLKEISRLKILMDELPSWHLREMITRENIDDIFNEKNINVLSENEVFSEIKESQYFSLIKYLIRNGYIDETYADYMTYFYGESICHGDKVFLRGITDQKAKEYTYKLREPSKVVSIMNSRNYKQVEALNYDLLDYLLENNDEESVQQYIHDILQQIINAQNKEFIFQYLRRCKNEKLFVHLLNMQWENIMNYMCESENVTDEEREKYIWETLCLSTDGDLSVINVDGVLTKYISQNTNFLCMKDRRAKIAISNMEKIDVKFQIINFECANDDLLKDVYEKNLYTLTFSNVCMMLKRFYDISDDEKMIHCNLSCIVSRNGEPLYNYVVDNIESYIDVVLKNCQGCILDKLDVIYFVLDNKNIETDIKAKYVSYLKTRINQIEKVEDKELWRALLQYDVVKYSLGNIFSFFVEMPSESRIDLYGYLNEHSNEVLSGGWNDEFKTLNEERQSDMFDAVVIANQLDNNVYRFILQNMGDSYEEFDVKDIEEEKVNILIELNIIPMTDETLKFMRQEYPSTVINLICNNVRRYCEYISKNIICVKEILDVIEENVTVEDKLELLSLVPNEKISIRDKGYEDEIIKYIVKNNFDENDIEQLIRDYKKASSDFKRIIIDKFAECTEYLLENEIKVPYDVCSQLLSRINGEAKWKIFINSLPIISPYNCIKCLDLFESNDDVENLKRIFIGKRPRFENKKYIKDILTVFDKKGWVSSISESDEYLIAYGRKNETIMKMVEDNILTIL
ncbi:hypothetical protein SELR_10930 [Selenomonas ruminantium subsp. lactilytica TAM6421]|uniref:YobI-like P-loop NTPase domain-containing protein n=1 Tax=Selenomonas ruminantium subsp. lactilytica (strain NBRC 103574 / TAM6421) TaxID=927704 RepID=I0GPW4_SELRL|nr:hypothetical protein [Selenomonas ruminantium]BAL82801.1 hypothetical protein SELR_10930 [Selenomonas ruminantium subsp. lactilytica TAM6421]